MKKVAGTLRLDLAQYREKQAFAQFGSDLDAVTRQQLSRGERLVELLKQPQYQPMPVELQVVSIIAANKGFLDKIEVEQIASFEVGLHEYLAASHGSVLKTIREKGALDEAADTELSAALERYTDDFIANAGVEHGGPAESAGSASSSSGGGASQKSSGGPSRQAAAG